MIAADRCEEQKGFSGGESRPTVMAGWSGRRYASREIVAILKAGIGPNALPL
jgi:hypothetical protein